MKMSLKPVAGILLTLVLTAGASAADLKVNGVTVQNDVAPQVINNTTYVSLRAMTEALRSDVEISWNGRAVARASGLTVTAAPGEQYIEANGRALYVNDGVKSDAGRILVPLRVLARALDAQVSWDVATGDINVTQGSGAIPPARYNQDDLYWLSRIISAESQGEPLAGKIAVGNVVQNRVKSSEFPDTVYGVIFDNRWGGQFTPVKNGAIYREPTAESVLAAKLCLEGANTAGESIYFLAPAIASNHWAMQNRPYVTSIGSHWFYR